VSEYGAILRGLRMQRGCTRSELAAAAHISEGAIRDYEQGKREPSFANVVRLARALRATVETFVPAVDVADVYVLSQRDSRYSTLTFGMHKGKRLNNVPEDYLHWLLRERPRQLKPAQVAEIEALIGRLHSPTSRERRPPTPEVEPLPFGKPVRRGKTRAQSRASGSSDAADRLTPDPSVFGPAPLTDDEVIARLKRERMGKLTPGPDVFG